MLFKKTDYDLEFRKAVDNNDLKKAEKLAIAAFKKEPSNEHLLAMISGNIYERELWAVGDLIAEFVDRFPDSLHAIRVFHADIMARRELYDEATFHARYYLRIVKENNQLKAPTSDIIRNGMGRGFLLLTSAYTELGARSYSRRVLEHGHEFVSDHWQQIYNQELSTLTQELTKEESSGIDENWEAFFQSDANADQQVAYAEEKGFPQLAKRVDLIADQFAFNSNYSPGIDEMFQIVYEGKEQFSLI